MRHSRRALLVQLQEKGLDPRQSYVIGPGGDLMPLGYDDPQLPPQPDPLSNVESTVETVEVVVAEPEALPEEDGKLLKLGFQKLEEQDVPEPVAEEATTPIVVEQAPEPVAPKPMKSKKAKKKKDVEPAV